MEAAFGKIQVLEKNGGSLIGGSFKLFQDRRNNPGPPRDPNLPPKPPGQTVASFRRGLKTLPDARANKLVDKIRRDWKLKSVSEDDNELFVLEYETPDGTQIISSKSVALTVPSHVAADILHQYLLKFKRSLLCAVAAANSLESFVPSKILQFLNNNNFKN